jgi:uridine kinase
VNIKNLVDSIIDARSAAYAGRALLVGISGIDASGKGYVAAKISRELEQVGFRVAVINVDGWLNLPEVRFGSKGPGKHFYEHALRLDEIFERLVLPLKMDRSIDLTFDLAEETANSFRPFRCQFENIDIVLLEGIFILKRAFVELFDLKIWIECSFESALARAISRSQEGLSPIQTKQIYESIYFPAQRQHISADHPAINADLILKSD